MHFIHSSAFVVGWLVHGAWHRSKCVLPQAPFLIDQSDLGVADIIPLRPHFGGANNNQ